ncbi:MAG: Guanylate kinase [Chroococcopsis gigantea SAG 12.99]|jgi:guanylate kinase|nr:guanylate kinase [Chlorogloea purpurea SAG 13.99]MDV3001238.1 Guanylate kinase [Chroococcopsis gigantea SAG 12.99]
MKSGQLIVITGPSGVGKGTLVKLLRERHQELALSVSVTTRNPRPGEQEGQNYYFVNREQFTRMMEAGQLLEWAEYAGNYYGTPRKQVQESLDSGKSLILEIELLGARQIGQMFPNAKRIFILPPSVEELTRRLRDRGDETESAIALRLARATEELAASAEFPIIIVNDDLDQALEQLEKAIWGE